MLIVWKGVGIVGISCDCSCDIDGGPNFSKETFPKARKNHKCCECKDSILPGSKYNRIKGMWDGKFLTFCTCMACHRIREHYCSSGYMLGDLRDQISECIGFDYTEIPEGDD